jgi:N-acetylmuramoyl-L-alanine amidase
MRVFLACSQTGFFVIVALGSVHPSATIPIAVQHDEIYTEEALACCLLFRRVPLFLCLRFSSYGRSSRKHTSVCVAALGMTAATFFCAQMMLASSSHRESVVAYARAENLRRHLESKPISARTREDYVRALNAYRVVYHGDPASPDAGRSIAAVADLLASEGRCLHDAKLFHDAIAQWEFLRREYPQTPLRQHALFEEARIAQYDLQDRAAAKKIYRNFLAHYPHDPLADQARAGLEDAHPHQQREISRTTPVRPHVATAQSVPQPDRRVASQHLADLRHVPTSRSEPSSTDFRVTRIALKQPALPAAAVTIQAVRNWTEKNATRIAVDMNAAVPYRVFQAENGKQITVIFFGAHPSESLISDSVPLRQDAIIRSIRASALTGNQAELVVELNHPATFSSFTLSNPARIILDVRAAGQGGSSPVLARTVRVPTAAEPAMHIQARTPPRHESPATAVPNDEETATVNGIPQEIGLPSSSAPDEQHSMTRVLGLRIRRIAIDAGHGGHDSGTLGPGGLEEKDIALDIALRLGHLLHQRLGADVVYTRRRDVFVPLGQRTAIANRAHADLFLSIHANSSSDPEVRGVETYFLNFTASPDALQVAARENATSNRSVHELSALVRKITLSDKIDESREFAGDVQQSLYDGLAFGNYGLKNRGVKQAPFAVLIGANMPSILAEISFLTNPADANELARAGYRERLAEALYIGVAKYVDGMSGVRVAKTAQPEALAVSAESSAE